MPAGSQEKRVGLHDLARALGLSIGTVDRALHDRPGVNPMTRAKVLQMARTLGYRPNLAARALASKRSTRIAAVVPRDEHGYFDEVREGILEAARPFENAGLTVEFHEYPWLDEHEAELIDGVIDEGVDGLIIAPGSPDAVRGAIRKASRKNVPVVCVATDAPGTERLTVVRADPAASGSIAAELIGKVLWGRGLVAVFTGCVQTSTHRETLEGFRATLAADYPEMQLGDAIETHDDADQAYRNVMTLFAKREAPAGIFVSTSNSAGVFRALDELDQTGRVVLVTMDLSDAIAQRIRSGAVLASIWQRPRNQGRQAFRALSRFVVEGVCPPAQIRFSPHIVLRGNLHLFVNRDATVHSR